MTSKVYCQRRDKSVNHVYMGYGANNPLNATDLYISYIMFLQFVKWQKRVRPTGGVCKPAETFYEVPEITQGQN